MRAAAAALGLVAVAACHRARPEELAAACQPASQATLAAASAAALGGEHDVTLVATSGPRSGHAIHGRLELRGQADSLKRGPWAPAEQQFIGWLDVSPEDVGAVRMGDPDVGVYVSPAANGVGIVARIGAISNSRGEQGIDAGYFALHVRDVADGMIRGAWTSGDGRNEVAAGHFCARRR